jgi:hypothetical protein
MLSAPWFHFPIRATDARTSLHDPALHCGARIPDCIRTGAELFESLLSANKLPFEKIKEDTSPRPDYLVSIGDLKVVFEVKELAEDENFGVVKDPAHPHIKMHSRTLGDVRRRIECSKKQIHYGAEQGFPSIRIFALPCPAHFQCFGLSSAHFHGCFRKSRYRLAITVGADHLSRSVPSFSSGKSPKSRFSETLLSRNVSALWVSIADALSRRSRARS